MNDWLYTMLEDDTCQGRKCRKKEQAWGRINGVGGAAAWLRRWPVKKDLRQKEEALGNVEKNLQEDKITRTKARARVGCWLLFSRSVMPASLWPHRLQHARIPCPPSLPTISCSLLKLISTESMVPSSHLILCRPLLLLPSIFPSIRVFSSESALRIRWPKDWHFSFSISPSTESSGLIAFRVDWFDLPTVQGTLKSLPSTTAQKHQFFGAQPEEGGGGLIIWALKSDRFGFEYWQYNIWSLWLWKNYSTSLSAKLIILIILKNKYLLRHKLPSSVAELTLNVPIL